MLGKSKEVTSRPATVARSMYLLGSRVSATQLEHCSADTISQVRPAETCRKVDGTHLFRSNQYYKVPSLSLLQDAGILQLLSRKAIHIRRSCTVAGAQLPRNTVAITSTPALLHFYLS